MGDPVYAFFIVSFSIDRRKVTPAPNLCVAWPLRAHVNTCEKIYEEYTVVSHFRTRHRRKWPFRRIQHLSLSQSSGSIRK